MFVDEYNANSFVMFFDPKDPFTEGNNWVAQWRPIRPDVTRLGLLHPSLDSKVRDLVSAVLELIDVTGQNVIAVSENRTVDLDPAHQAKEGPWP
jgi:hypothetical protein